MEDIMSSYSFSHQFYQHWTRAPEPIRAAIVQELTDINTLLQPDTSFENFVFSEHDLDSHLDKLYNTHKTQQAAAKGIADQQAKRAAEQQRLEEEKKAAEANKIKAEKDKKEIEHRKENTQKEQVKVEDKNSVTKQTSINKIPENKPSHKQNDNDNSNKADATIGDDTDSIESNDASNADKETIDNSVNNNGNANNDNTNKGNAVKDESAAQVDAIPDDLKQKVNIEPLPKNPELSKDNEALIHELGMHIDDYLSEQMAQMSENLKSWLRAEISHQLSEKEQTNDGVDK